MTANVTSVQFLNALDGIWACEEEPTCTRPDASLLDLMLATCALGWADAVDLMSESRIDYENCEREIAYRDEIAVRTLRRLGAY